MNSQKPNGGKNPYTDTENQSYYYNIKNYI